MRCAVLHTQFYYTVGLMESILKPCEQLIHNVLFIYIYIYISRIARNVGGVKLWRISKNIALAKKTLANHQLGRSSRIKQKFRPPNASGGLGVKLWQIEEQQNIKTTCKTLQIIADSQRYTDIRPWPLVNSLVNVPSERAVYSRLINVLFTVARLAVVSRALAGTLSLSAGTIQIRKGLGSRGCQRRARLI